MYLIRTKKVEKGWSHRLFYITAKAIQKISVVLNTEQTEVLASKKVDDHTQPLVDHNTEAALLQNRGYEPTTQEEYDHFLTMAINHQSRRV